MNSNKKWDTLITCLLVSYVIVSLRYFKNYPIEVVNLMNSLLGMAEAAIVAFGLSPLAQFLSKIPISYILIAISITGILLESVILLCTKKSAKQSVVILTTSFFKVLLSGLMLYFMFCTIIFTFVYSVVGIPFAIALFLVLVIFIMLGNIPLSIYIGTTIQQLLNIKPLNMYSNFLLGSFIICLSKTVYSVGGALIFFVYPVITFGIVFMYIINVKILKNGCIDNNNDKENFDREKIRDIISKDI